MDISSLGSGAQSGTAQPQSVPILTSQSPPNAAASQQAGKASETTSAQQTDATAVAHASQTEPSEDQVKQAVQKINTSLAASQSQSSIEFSMNATSHRIVVKVVDQSTNQVIRQIPSKQALAIADSLDQSQDGQSAQGLLINQQA